MLQGHLEATPADTESSEELGATSPKRPEVTLLTLGERRPACSLLSPRKDLQLLRTGRGSRTGLVAHLETHRGAVAELSLERRACPRRYVSPRQASQQLGGSGQMVPRIRRAVQPPSLGVSICTEDLQHKSLQDPCRKHPSPTPWCWDQ